MLTSFIQDIISKMWHIYIFSIESQIAPANDTIVAERNKYIFFLSVISLSTNIAKSAFTIQHSSAIGYAFPIPIEITAIRAKKFPTDHINQEKRIGRLSW